MMDCLYSSGWNMADRGTLTRALLAGRSGSSRGVDFSFGTARAFFSFQAFGKPRGRRGVVSESSYFCFAQLEDWLAEYSHLSYKVY